MIRTKGAIWAIVLALAGCGGGKTDPCGLAASCSTPSDGNNGGTNGGSVPPIVASDLTLQLSGRAVQNTGTDTIKATATAVDANRNLLAKAPVTIRVDNNATVGVSGTVTDEQGVVTGTVSIGTDRSNRVITVTATSGNLTRTETFQVTGARIVATAVPQVVVPGGAGVVRFRLIDANDDPIRGEAAVVTGIGGVSTSGTTDMNGEFVYSYTAPTVSGAVEIRITAAGASAAQTIQVQSTAVPPAAPGIESASLALSSTVVTANTLGPLNQIEVRALFLRDTNKPAANVRVRFDLDGDVNDVPGTLSAGNNIIYSDSTGMARTSYTPGSRTSPTDGVTIRACWDYQDFTACSPGRVLRARLTVIAEPLSVSIGTDNFITTGTTKIDYVKRHLVQVNDASGAPRANVQISAVLDLPRYFTGEWLLQGLNWVQNNTGSCDNEDLNRNHAIETYVNGAVEDFNRNGQLDPRAADVVVSFEGSSKTDAAGQAVVRITYLPSSASWIEYKLQVVAQGVSGSEGRASYGSILPVPAETVISQDGIKPPPRPIFAVSPFNVSDPTRAQRMTNPDGTSGMLCPARF